MLVSAVIPVVLELTRMDHHVFNVIKVAVVVDRLVIIIVCIVLLAFILLMGDAWMGVQREVFTWMELVDVNLLVYHVRESQLSASAVKIQQMFYITVNAYKIALQVHTILG